MDCAKHSILERPRSGHVTSPRGSGERLPGAAGRVRGPLSFARSSSAAVEDQRKLAQEAQARAQRDEAMRTALLNTPPKPKPVKRKPDWIRAVVLEPKPEPFGDDSWEREVQRTVVIDDSTVLRIGGPGGIEMRVTTLLEMLQRMASDIEQLKALVAAKATSMKRTR
jgi:hypothetical protein